MTSNLTKNDIEKIQNLNILLQKNPSDIDLLSKKAFIYFQAYDDKNTIKTYKEIISLDSKNIDAYFWLSYYLFRVACDPENSIIIAKQGLEIDPNSAKLNAVMAWAIDFSGSSDIDYLYYLKKSIELDPTWISTRISLIEYLIKTKKLDMAKQEIFIALKHLNSNLENNNLNSKDDIQEEYESITRKTDSSAEQILQKFLYEIK